MKYIDLIMRQFTEEDIKKAFLEGFECAREAACVHQQYDYNPYISYEGFNEFSAADEYVEKIKCSK
jgi:hypothetical protein